ICSQEISVEYDIEFLVKELELKITLNCLSEEKNSYTEVADK
ncbi:17787_t:CDS:2, partial [Funneliformis caledonium]